MRAGNFACLKNAVDDLIDALIVGQRQKWACFHANTLHRAKACGHVPNIAGPCAQHPERMGHPQRMTEPHRQGTRGTRDKDRHPPAPYRPDLLGTLLGT